MKSTLLWLPLLLTVLLSACSHTPAEPSEADARAAVEQQIKTSSQGCVRLVELHRIGEHSKDLGNLMMMKVSAEIEFLEDCDWPIDNTILALKTVPGKTPGVRKSEHRTVTLDLQFHRTAQGWKSAP